MFTIERLSKNVLSSNPVSLCKAVVWAGRRMVQFSPVAECKLARYTGLFSSASYTADLPCRILSIHGGGIRGIIPGIVMKHMEEHTGRPLHHLFDVIGGTSTGGILALSASAPKAAGSRENRFSAHEIVSIYTDPRISQQIFSLPERAPVEPVRWPHRQPGMSCNFSVEFGGDEPPTFKSDLPIPEPLRELVYTKYSTHGLVKILRQRFDNLELKDLLTEVLITSVDIKTRTPKLFTRTKARLDPSENHLIWKIARSTSAAPTFFDPFELGHMDLVDGGIVANNPALCTIFSLFEKNVPYQNMLCVSLGTGHYVPLLNTKGHGKIPFATKLFGILSETSAQLVDHHAKLLLGSRYYPFQPSLKRDISLDDTSESTLEELVQIGTQLVKDRRGEINQVCDTLAKIWEIRQYPRNFKS